MRTGAQNFSLTQLCRLSCLGLCEKVELEEEEEKEERARKTAGAAIYRCHMLKGSSTYGKNYLLLTAGGEPTSHNVDQPHGGKTCTS